MKFETILLFVPQGSEYLAADMVFRVFAENLFWDGGTKLENPSSTVSSSLSDQCVVTLYAIVRLGSLFGVLS